MEHLNPYPGQSRRIFHQQYITDSLHGQQTMGVFGLKYHKNIIISARFPPKAPLARLGRDDYNKKRDIYKRDLA
jgi:hypothetical protein